MSAHTVPSGGYYQPGPSWWPLIGSLGLLCLAGGFALLLNGNGAGKWLMPAGAGILVGILFGWFGNVIRESLSGAYNLQVDHSYRWGMAWFIFSEVMFFAAFFGALLYAREVASSLLLKSGLLWPNYTAAWPSAGPGSKEAFTPMEAWGIPAINTAILLSSGATVTWAHWGLVKAHRGQLKLGLALTILLGATFLVLQAWEYGHAAFSLKTGIYGATFFMLTGFHGLHVSLGVIMLTVILGRSLAGHFSPNHHFAFEAVSWYWHFVDVVWLLLFVFVYWL